MLQEDGFDENQNSFPRFSLFCHYQQVEGGDSSPLMRVCEAIPEVLCPILGSPVQDRHGYTGKIPAKELLDDLWTWTFSPMRKGWKRRSCSTEKREASRESYQCG